MLKLYRILNMSKKIYFINHKYKKARLCLVETALEVYSTPYELSMMMLVVLVDFVSHLEAKVTTEFSRGRGIFLHDPVLKEIYDGWSFGK